MNTIMNNLTNVLFAIAIILFVFILIREVVCWYFKINERVQLLKDAIKNDEEIIRLLAQGNQYQHSATTTKSWGGQPGGKGGDGIIGLTR